MQLYFFKASGVGENRQRRLAVLVSVFIAEVRKSTRVQAFQVVAKPAMEEN